MKTPAVQLADIQPRPRSSKSLASSSPKFASPDAAPSGAAEDSSPKQKPRSQQFSRLKQYAHNLKTLRQDILQHHSKAGSRRKKMLLRALMDARHGHRGQWRYSGEPYILHPMRVALMTAQAGLDVESTIVALLHDLIEDTEFTKAQMQQTYGNWTADMVEGLTKVYQVNQNDGVHTLPVFATYRRLISQTVRDIRTLQVKLFDRLDNMHDLAPLPRNKQRSISRETWGVYVPMAERLGMQNLAEELATLAFSHLYPLRYTKTLAWLKDKQKEESMKTQALCGLLKKELQPVLKNFTFVPLYQHISEFLSQEQLPARSFKGVEIIVPNAQSCYKALGRLHMRFRVAPISIRDYISNPLPNHYQGLHSELFIGGERVFFRIVSFQMRHINQRGILEGWKGSKQELAHYYTSYLEMLEHYQEDNLRMEDVLRYARMDTLQVFTPKGELRTLPAGSSVLDFAFAIHTDLGLHCCGARIGERRTGPFEILSDGEVVEVLTRTDNLPRTSWLQHVRTSRARLALRRWLNTCADRNARILGRQRIQAILKHALPQGPTLTTRRNFLKALQNEELDLRSFYFQVGAGKLDARAFFIKHQLFPQTQLKPLQSEKNSRWRKWFQRTHTVPQPQLQLGHNPEALNFIHLATCCLPLPGDDVTGYQQERQLTLHRNNCKQVPAIPPQNRISVSWQSFDNNPTPLLRIRTWEDKPGQLFFIIRVMRDLQVNINSIQLAPNRPTDINLQLAPISLKQFRNVIQRLRSLKPVKEVRMSAF